MLSGAGMEVVPHLPAPPGAATSPFTRRDVAEWSRMDRLTGVMETARVETDRWAQATPTAKHAYGKVVDSRDRTLPDGSARQRQRQQLEVFQTHGPGGSLQVIRTQSVTSTNSSWRTSTSGAQPARAALPSIIRDFGGDLQLTLNPLDLSREKSKGTVGRSGSIGARRPPSRPRTQPPPPPAPDKAEQEEKEAENEAANDVDAPHEPPPVSLHSLLSRQRSSSTEDITASLDSAEPEALRRSSRARRSLQFSAHSLEARGGVARLLQDLEERGLPQGSDSGRSVNNVSLDSFSRKFANAKMRHSYSESNDDDEADAERKKVATKRHSFVTVESLKEVRGRLKQRAEGVDVGRVSDDVKDADGETAATSLVKSYVYGMEALNRGTGSLESRTGSRAGRSDEWYNRRKSYGFERVGGDTSNSSSSTLSSGAGAVESNDSGIHHSNEMFSTPTWSRRTALVTTEDPVKRGSTVVNLGGDAAETTQPSRGALLSALLVNGVRGDDRRVAVSIPVTLSDDSPTVESRRLFYQQLAQGTTLSVERALKKSLEQTSPRTAVGDDWWMRPRFPDMASTDEWTLPSLKRHSFAGNGWRSDAVDVATDEVKRHSIAVDESRYSEDQGAMVVVGDADRKNGGGGKKRVEFCKTEVHFAAEPGRFNIVETDEKPPSTNMFRRRRRATNTVVATASNLPEVRFGDHERGQVGKETTATTSSQQRILPRPTTLRLNLEEDVQEKEHQDYTESNATIRPAVEDQDEEENFGRLELMDSSTDSRPRGILKPRLRPPAYLLGAHQSDSEARTQGQEPDQSEERWGVRLRPVDAPARPIPSRDAVMPAEYSGQSELQKLLRSLRPATQRLRGESDASDVKGSEWCATDRLNGSQDQNSPTEERDDVETVPGWTAKSGRTSDWPDKPMKITDWTTKTEKSSEWLNETEKLADWSPMSEKIADWTAKTENGSSWQSKSMDRQNKFTERLNAKVEKLAGTRTDKLSNWSPKSFSGTERLTKSLDRQNILSDRQSLMAEDRTAETTDKLSDWSPKTETLSDWSSRKEKLVDRTLKSDKLSDWSKKSDTHMDFSPTTEKATKWQAKAEHITSWSPKADKLTDWSVAERVRSVEASKGFSTRVNFGPGETTVVAPPATVAAKETRRFSSGDRPKPVWQRREEALAAADGKPGAGTTTKITIDLTSLTVALDAPRARAPTWSSPAIGDRGIADGEGSPDKVENGFHRLCVGDDRERGWDDVLVASSLPPVNGHHSPSTPSWLEEETTWYDNKQYRQHTAIPGSDAEKACVEQRTWKERSSASKPTWKPKTSWGGRVWDKEDSGQVALDSTRVVCQVSDAKRKSADCVEKGPPEELVVTESSWRKDSAVEDQELVIDESSWSKTERVREEWRRRDGNSSKEKDAPEELVVDEPSWRARKQLKGITPARAWRSAASKDSDRNEDCTTAAVETTPTAAPTSGLGLGAQLAAWRALCNESDSSESVSDQEADLEVRSFMSHEASGSWRRRRPGEGFASAETHTSTATAPVPSYDAGSLRSVETLVNVRSGQPRITSISLRYHGDEVAPSVRHNAVSSVRGPRDLDGEPPSDARRPNGILTRLNGKPETSPPRETGKFTSRTSISPERPSRDSPGPTEPAFKITAEPTTSRSLFQADAARSTKLTTTSFGQKSPELLDADDTQFQRTAPGRARLRATETVKIGTVKQAVNASPLAARRVTSATSSVGSSAREPIGRKQVVDQSEPRETNAKRNGQDSALKEVSTTKHSVGSTSPLRRPASLKDITEAPTASNGVGVETRHTFTSSSFQRQAESSRMRERSASQSPDAEAFRGRSPLTIAASNGVEARHTFESSSFQRHAENSRAQRERSASQSPDAEAFRGRSPLDVTTPRSASLSPVYQNRSFYRENSGLEAESDSVILAELTRAAEEILRAVHGYTDEETQPAGEQPDTRRTNQRRPLGTIAETQVLRKTAAKEVRTQRESARLASKPKTKLGPTSSNSSVEGVEPRRPIRADAVSKRPARTETTEKRSSRAETTDKRPTRTERVSRTARMVQRASSRELLLQTHASSSEDVASGSEGPKQRAPPRRRSTTAKGATSASKVTGGRTEKSATAADFPTGRVSRDRTSSSRTKARDSTAVVTASDSAKKTPETKQYPLKEKTIPGIVSHRDRSARGVGGTAAAVRTKKTVANRAVPLSTKAGK